MRVFPGGGGIVYGIKADGTLEWRDMTPRSGRRPGETKLLRRNVAYGWSSFADVFSGGEGVIYVVGQDGSLTWYRHVSYLTGEPFDTPGAWSGPRNVGRGWSGYKHVFSGGNGVIYVISEDGTLKWYRHRAYLTGEGLDSPGSWQGPKNVGRGWADVEQVFSAGDGIIYAITSDGKLKWFKHAGYLDGRGFESAGAWEGPKDVGRGWGELTKVFAQF
jgi:hypothetical protein